MLKAIQSALPFLPDPGPTVSILRLEGTIGRSDASRRGLSADGLESAITKAFAQPSLAAVALAINSPGGSPVQSRLIADRIRHLADLKNVNVFAFCEDVAASGGYMLALAADEIFADVSSLVGSIGVVGASFGLAGAMEKLGIERRVYTQGKNKVRLDPFQAEKPDDREFVARIQSAIHKEFIDFVKARRSGRLDLSKDLFEGDIFTAREAHALGLIDGIGHLRETMKERFGHKVDFRQFGPSRPSLVQRLVGDAAHQMIGVVEERALWSRYGL